MLAIAGGNLELRDNTVSVVMDGKVISSSAVGDNDYSGSLRMLGRLKDQNDQGRL